MRETISSPPRTIMEVYRMLPEGTLAELINGVIYMSPAPKPHHQRISRLLILLLSEFIEQKKLGEIFNAPIDVFLGDDQNAVQPDLVFISSTNSHIVKETAIEGVPDLLVEILSPGNDQHDLVKKKDLYQAFGVREYWIVDPDTKKTLVYELRGKVYRLVSEQSGKIVSPLFQHTFEF